MRVLVLGEGIYAFAAAYVFKQHGMKVLILNQGENQTEISQDFLYIRNTPETTRMMKGLGILYSTFIVRGGIMLHEEMQPFPQCFKQLDKDYVSRIRYDYFRKTRKIKTTNTVKAMLKPISTKTKTAIRADVFELNQKMSSSTKVIRRKATKITSRYVEVMGGQRIHFDKLVVACPLWEIKEAATWPIPDVLAMRSHVARVTSKTDIYEKFDFFFTPYTPANCIHFVWSDGEFFFTEMSGEFDMLALKSDLNFLFKQGWYISRIYKNLKGYTLPFQADVSWPANIHPVSPYSRWNDQLSFDDTVSEATRLVKEWTSI